MEHAGYSTLPGRAKCALNLARAEQDGKAAGLTFEWSADPDGCSMCQCCSKEKCGDVVVEECLCRNEAGDVVASLCGICGADNNYRRVVEAELALEAKA